MKKIALIGSSGAGKSTLSRELTAMLSIPVYHLDQLNWREGCEEVSREEQIRLQDEIFEKEEWIIDGNYGGTLSKRVEEADTILFFDFPRMLCMTRAAKRVLKYRNTVRPDMAEGCPERFDYEFFKYIWNFPEQKTPHIVKRLRELPSDKRVVHFNKPSDVERFLSTLRKKQAQIK
ncbi:DNA topology modulation protein [Chryseomicrobium sp. FSL W7-1435]|uniref:DNA topology modulation protein n=1 Tax=Chryseomicrobium sp. FSL W7-1435 TaxID=2921704 RepID=UPI00315B1EA2